MQLLFPKGYIDYATSMKWFEPIASDSDKDIEKIYVFEHQDVYTAGKSINKKNTEKQQFINHTPVIYTSRGGLWTWHGKGQVIVYFIYNLRKRNIALSDFMSLVEQTVIENTTKLLFESPQNETLKTQLQIYADSNKRGFWVKNNSTECNDVAKFGFIGLRVSHGYVYHGISINFNNNLSAFDYIDPCGLGGVKITSIKEIYNLLHQDKIKLPNINTFKQTLGDKLFKTLNSIGSRIIT